MPQCQIGKAFQISSSTVHNIKDSGKFRISEISEKSLSVHKRQGRRPFVGCHGLRFLRRHCITHRHDSVIDITKWAREYFQKPLSVNIIRRAIYRFQYVSILQKRRLVLWAKANLKWTVSMWESVLLSEESKFDILVGNHRCRVLQAKEEWIKYWLMWFEILLFFIYSYLKNVQTFPEFRL